MSTDQNQWIVKRAAMPGMMDQRTRYRTATLGWSANLNKALVMSEDKALQIAGRHAGDEAVPLAIEREEA